MTYDLKLESFTEAEKKDLIELEEKGMFKRELLDEAGPNPHTIPWLLALWIKLADAGNEVLKARFLFVGHTIGKRTPFFKTPKVLNNPR